ncbi:hypothetical protein [Streptomyces cremeus]|uniref:Uncharacterized protein n=1 Tax=Streptomyces cremeus TaxID=66881 RepID=A0ABV5P5L9_STRCM
MTAAAVAGVARLAGLDERATAALHAGAKVRGGGLAPLLPGLPKPASVPLEEVLDEGEERFEYAVAEPAPGADGAGRSPEGYSKAVAAAMAVLHEDRFRPWPQK